jgi:uncharacterized membrane protein YebE (DUF533 family)
MTSNLILGREYGIDSLDLVPREAQVAYFAALRRVALVSGVDAAEAAVLETLGAALGVADDVLAEAAGAAIDDQSVSALPADFDRAYLVRDAVRVALADGKVDLAEQEQIARLAALTGVSAEKTRWIVCWVEREQHLGLEWGRLVDSPT